MLVAIGHKMANVYTFRGYNYCKQATSYLDGVISAGIIYTYIYI